MKIVIGADHGGVALKEHLADYLSGHAYTLQDVGTSSDVACDYPDIVQQFQRAFSLSDGDRGILVCGSGQGVCMAANRMQGIRAALCRTTDDAKQARNHNDANVLCLGGRVTSVDDAAQIADVFFREEFYGGRHETRVRKLEALGGQRCE